MWILNYITQNTIPDKAAEKGLIKGSLDGRVEVNASSDFKSIPIAAPYGIAYVPPEGEKSVVVSASGDDICLGTIIGNKGLKPGEIMLFSKGGATLTLSNDGYVYANGVRIG